MRLNDGCSSPCHTSEHNTPQCESLPSQIDNFTKQFFGTVVKTEVNGQIVWNLPCGLDTGLPNNPRAADEGLACYFQRLFLDGIVGLQGPEGEPGTPGANGHNAFTITLAQFTQPTAGNPSVQIAAYPNPGILAGQYVFIQTSGWYIVNVVDTTSGALFLTLAKALDSAPGTISAGKLVVPSGFPGESVQGPQGIQGPPGPQGATGNTFTTTNDFYFATVGTDFSLQVTYGAVNFVNSSPAFVLPAAGIYLVTVVADLLGVAPVASSDVASLKLRNTTTASDVPGSEHKISNLIDTERNQLVINARVITDGVNQSLALFGKASTADIIKVVALNTTMTYVRVS